MTGRVGRGARKDQPGGAGVLSLATDKPAGEIGTNGGVDVTCVATSGRALITIENGSPGVVTWWAETNEAPTQHQIRITPQMAPNVRARHYVAAARHPWKRPTHSHVRCHAPGCRGPDNRTQPRVETSDVFEPISRAQVQISEAKGREMTYTLAIVDEGLLGLTRFKPPIPGNTSSRGRP